MDNKLKTNDLKLFTTDMTKTNRMKKLNFRIVFTAITLALLTVIGCQIRPIDDVSFTGLESQWAVPLIDTDKTFGDIINNFDPKAFIQIAADGGIVLRYKGVYTAKSSLDIFANFQNATFPLTDTVMAIPFRLPQGVSIDSVKMKGGSLQWVFLASPEPLKVVLRMPQLKKNGVEFRQEFTLSTSLSSGGINLEGYDLKPLRDSIFITHDARKISNGERVSLKNMSGVIIKDFQAAFAVGYFGLSVFDSPRDTIKIDFFDQWKGGSVKFGNPKLIATLDNSFGVPVRAVMTVGEITTIDGQLLKLRSPLAAGVDVNYPTYPNEIGKSKRTVVTFDKSNSNLDSIISQNPTSIDYKLDGFLNADTSRKITGFLTDTSKFNLQVELEVPMEGKATNFEVNDTFAINLADAREITKAEFKLLTDNGMPIDVAIQGYFATDKGQVLDSLYTQKAQILKGAPVGANGLPTGISSVENLITIEAAKMNKIRNVAKKLIIRYSFSTSNGGSVAVKLAAKQGVRVRLSVKFAYKAQ
jgi:hypothetical protein